MVLRLSLETFVFPALVCVGVFALLQRWLGRAAAAAAALAAGYISGQYFSIGFPPIPPVETTQWLLLLVATAGAVALLPLQGWSKRLIVSLVLAATVIITLNPMWRFHWSAGTTCMWLVGLVLALLLLCSSTEALARRSEGHLIPLSFAAVGLISAAILAMSATTLLAQLSATTTACLGVLFLVGWRTALAPNRWIPVALVILTGLILNGYFYAQLSGWSAICLLAALPAAWLSRLPTLSRRPPWVRTVGALAAITLVTAPALTMAALDFFQEPEYDYYEEY